MSERWAWSRNEAATELPVESEYGRSTIYRIHTMIALTMDPRLTLARHRMLMDPVQNMTAVVSRWEATPGDGMIDVIVGMDMATLKMAGTTRMGYFVEYRFAGMWERRLDLSSESDAVEEFAESLDKHEALVTTMVDKVTPVAGAVGGFVHMTPLAYTGTGPVSPGSAIGYVGTGPRPRPNAVYTGTINWGVRGE